MGTINRAPFNALVDDDGTGLVGSIWNKAQIQSVLLDPIDAAIGSSIVIASAASGVQNNWTPGLNGHTAIVWNGTADLSITGIAGGVAGQRVTIWNNSGNGSNIYLFPLNSLSASANFLENYALSAPTPIGYMGAATYLYTAGLWKLVAHEQGAWVTEPFVASNYAASGSMTWTVAAGNVAADRYRLSGRTLSFALNLYGTLAGTASNQITRQAYGFTTAANAIGGPLFANNGAATAPMPMASGTSIAMYRDVLLSTFTLGTVFLYGLSSIEVT
jgi:hypothetical protein